MASLEDGRMAIIEVKGAILNTRQRLEDAVEQLARYRAAYEEANPTRPVITVLVTSGALSTDYRKFLLERGIDLVIDGDIINQSENLPTIHRFLEEMKGEGPSQSAPRDASEILIQELRGTSAGRDDWSAYQKLCERILEYLFCPPLGRPNYERANSERTDRRAIVLANWVADPINFWGQMRAFYGAHLVVVDAKNWVNPISKNEVLKVAHYLKSHGAGRFGMIMSRKGCDQSASICLREYWMGEEKMIIVLNDAEVEQMLTLRRSGGNPSNVIRDKIEDFRLSF